MPPESDPDDLRTDQDDPAFRDSGFKGPGHVQSGTSESKGPYDHLPRPEYWTHPDRQRTSIEPTMKTRKVTKNELLKLIRESKHDKFEVVDYSRADSQSQLSAKIRGCAKDRHLLTIWIPW